MNKDSRIYVAGHNGLAGSAIVRELERKGYENILTASSKEIDLREPWATGTLFRKKPEYVFLAAAHAGGIKEAIDNPVEMLSDNLKIQNNVIEWSHKYNVKKLLFLGSSCIYPVDGKQPHKEEQLGTGKTDENWSYAIAKLAGIELCRAYHRQYGSNFIAAIPCNLYGPNDNFDLEKAHVIPALIRKCCEYEDHIDIWGDGSVYREFLYVDDLAKACVFLMENCDYKDLYDGVINVGMGYDYLLNEVIGIIEQVTNYQGKRSYHIDAPKGIMSKLMDVSRINILGWKAETSLEEGLQKTYEWYKENSARS